VSETEELNARKAFHDATARFRRAVVRGEGEAVRWNAAMAAAAAARQLAEYWDARHVEWVARASGAVDDEPDAEE
jgi:hypothetical protein